MGDAAEDASRETLQDAVQSGIREARLTKEEAAKAITDYHEGEA